MKGKRLQCCNTVLYPDIAVFNDLPLILYTAKCTRTFIIIMTFQTLMQWSEHIKLSNYVLLCESGLPGAPGTCGQRAPVENFMRLLFSARFELIIIHHVR